MIKLVSSFLFWVFGFTAETKIAGGEVQLKNGKLTGILVDNPMDLIDKVIPKPTKAQQIQALKDAQNICLEYLLIAYIN